MLETDEIFTRFLKKGHASQTFHREVLKRQYKKKNGLPERGMAPPQKLHGTTAAFRTERDILPPDRPDQFCQGKAFMAAAESLVSLKPEDQFQVPGFHPVIEEPIVADLLEAGRGYVHQETTDELFMGEGNLPFWLSRLSSPGRKGNLCFRNREDPAVGDGDPVSITPKVFDGVAKSVEGFFDIRAPVFFIKGIPENIPPVFLPQCFAGGRENKFFLLVQGIQACKIFPFEFIPEDPDRKEKFSGGLPDPVVRGKPAAGNDAVHVDMVLQFLVPGVEHLDDPRLCPKILFISGQFQERLGTALMEQAVKKLLVAVKKRV